MKTLMIAGAVLALSATGASAKLTQFGQVQDPFPITWTPTKNSQTGSVSTPGGSLGAPTNWEFQNTVLKGFGSLPIDISFTAKGTGLTTQSSLSGGGTEFNEALALTDVTLTYTGKKTLSYDGLTITPNEVILTATNGTGVISGDTAPGLSGITFNIDVKPTGGATNIGSGIFSSPLENFGTKVLQDAFSLTDSSAQGVLASYTTGKGAGKKTYEYLKGFTAESNGNFSADPLGVPEPATWAVMLVGLGAVGGAMRRRRALTAA